MSKVTRRFAIGGLLILILALLPILVICPQSPPDWPTAYADTIYISSLPYTCTQDNTLYYVGYWSGVKPPWVWACKLSSTGKGIDTNGKDNIMIAGDPTSMPECQSTITYGTTHDVYTYGILVNGGDSIHIYDVDLIPGAAVVDDTGAVALLVKGSATNVYVSQSLLYTDGLNGKSVRVWPDSSHGIWLDYCTFYNYGNSFVRRDPVTNNSTSWVVTGEYSGYPLGADEYHLKVTNCTFNRSIHVSIGVLGSNVKIGSTVMGAVAIITGNTFHQRTRDDLYPTDNGNVLTSTGDPFAVNFDGVAAGSEVANNSFYGDSTANEYGGDGILIQGARGTEASPVEIHDNYFDLRHGAHPSLSAVKQACQAVYLRRYDGGTHSYNQHVKIYNNWGQIWVDTLAATTSVGTYAEGIRVGLDSMTNNIEVFNNHIPVLRGDGVTNGSGLNVAALSVSRLDSLMATDAWIGVYNNNFYNNYWEAPITPVWLGANRIGQPCSNMQLVGDTIYCPNDDHDSTAFFFSPLNTYYWHSTNNKIIDAVYGGYASDSDVVHGYISAASDGLGKTLEHWVTLRVLVTGPAGLPKAGIPVTAENNYGYTYSLGNTESDGWAQGLVKYKFFGYDPDIYDDLVIGDSVAFNPFLLTAIEGTDTATSSIWITPTCKTDTLALTTVGEIPATGNYIMTVKKKPPVLIQ